MEFQTDGIAVVGVLPNEEGHPCLICGTVPEHVWMDLFVPEPNDVPQSIAKQVKEKTTLALHYRLCAKCHDSKPDPQKIRILLLERLRFMGEQK